MERLSVNEHMARNNNFATYCLMAPQPSQPLPCIFKFRYSRVSVLLEVEEFLVMFDGFGWNYSRFIFFMSALNLGSERKTSI